MRYKSRLAYIWRNRKAGSSRGGRYRKYLFLLPGLIGVFLLVLLPFADVVKRSFMTALSGRFAGFYNYRLLLQNQAFLLAVKNTVKFIALALPLLLGCSLLLALGMYRCPFLEKVKYLYLLPLAMPSATVVLVWKMLFDKHGFLNAWLQTHVDFMGGSTAFFILVGSYVWKNLGYTMILWLAGLKSLATDMLDAAKVDGAGRLQSFFQVMLPNLKRPAYTIVVLSFLNSFKVYREAYLVGGNYPDESIYLLQHVLNNWYVNLELDKMAAAAVLTALVLGTVCVLLQHQWEAER